MVSSKEHADEDKVSRAELDEADAGKIRVEDEAIVRCDTCTAGGGRGKVIAVAPLMGRRRLGAAGGGRLPQSDVQSARIELEADVRLIPGTRVDVVFSASPKLQPSGAHS